MRDVRSSAAVSSTVARSGRSSGARVVLRGGHRFSLQGGHCRGRVARLWTGVCQCIAKAVTPSCRCCRLALRSMHRAACVAGERAVCSGNQRGLQTRAGETRARDGAVVSARFGSAEVIGAAVVARPVHSRFTADARGVERIGGVCRGAQGARVPHWEPHRVRWLVSNDDETGQGVDVWHVAGVGIGVPHEGSQAATRRG